MLLTDAIGIESQSNEFPELQLFKLAGEELIEYSPYIYHPKMDYENGKSYHQVKHVSSAASAILFMKLRRLFQISSGRDGRASESRTRLIERTGIALPILAAQTNRLLIMRDFDHKPCLVTEAEIYWNAHV